MHQILTFGILSLDDLVVRCLAEQSQHKLELAFVHCILHGKHVVVAIVKD